MDSRPSTPEADGGYARSKFLSPARSWTLGFSLHVLTGFVAVFAHYSVMWVLTRLDMAAVPASALGFSAGALTRYVLSHYAVFTPTDGVQVTLFRFVIAIAAQLAANSLLLAAFLAQGLNVWLAQVSTTVLLTFANYVAYRLWVFRS